MGWSGTWQGVEVVPIVRVEIAKGVATVEQKRAVIRRMTDVLVEELGRDPEFVFVVIDEVDTDNWGRKGESLTELWKTR
jgi:4-oxalocrotonate tautomerase